jgi:cyclophilin family peptidyl-prolyl cis-trans isomerase
MKNIPGLLVVALLSLYACKEEKTPDPQPAEAKEDVIEMTTPYGNMYIWLYKATPLHRDNYLKLAGQGYFDNTTFHRVIPGFMIQGGDPNSKDSDPNNDGQGGPGYTVAAEIKSEIKHKRGVIAAARLSDNVNPAKASSGSQFYISVSTTGTASLDGKYTVFGYVMKGIECADSIVKQPRSPSPVDRPFTDQKMQVKVIKKSLTEIKNEYGYTPEF